MVVNEIRLEGFRNFELGAADFSDGVNILLEKTGRERQIF